MKTDLLVYVVCFSTSSSVSDGTVQWKIIFHIFLKT